MCPSCYSKRIGFIRSGRLYIKLLQIDPLNFVIQWIYDKNYFIFKSMCNRLKIHHIKKQLDIILIFLYINFNLIIKIRY